MSKKKELIEYTAKLFAHQIDFIHESTVKKNKYLGRMKRNYVGRFSESNMLRHMLDEYIFHYRPSLGKPNTKVQINSLIQEIKQDPSISISQRNYAIKKMEELKNKL